MDKKEKKRDISSFAHNLKELMNEPLENPLATLDRDLQHFLYGRIAILIKHNEGQPIGSLPDVGTVVGAALGSVVSAFCQNRAEADELDTLTKSIKSCIDYGFDTRIDNIKETSAKLEESKAQTEELTETVEG